MTCTPALKLNFERDTFDICTAGVLAYINQMKKHVTMEVTTICLSCGKQVGRQRPTINRVDKVVGATKCKFLTCRKSIVRLKSYNLDRIVSLRFWELWPELLRVWARDVQGVVSWDCFCFVLFLLRKYNTLLISRSTDPPFSLEKQAENKKEP